MINLGRNADNRPETDGYLAVALWKKLFKRLKTFYLACNALQWEVKTMEQDQLKQQYETLLQSMGYIELVVIATSLSYYALTLQQTHFEKILAGQLPPTAPPIDTFPIDFAVSGLLMGSLTYFYDLAQKGLEAPTTDPQVRQQAEINSLSSSLVLLAAVFRLYNLVYTQMHIQPTEQPLAEEILEEAAPF